MQVEKDESQEVETTTPEDQAAQAAAFESSFNEGQGTVATPKKEKAAKPEPAPEPTPAPTPEPTPAPTPAPATPEAVQPAPSPKAEDQEWKQELRKIQGQYGALKDLLTQTLKAKEDAGKPAELTPIELKRMKEHFPELHEHLKEDFAEVVAGLNGQKGPDLDIDALVKERVSPAIAKEVADIRADFVTAEHPSWRTDLWVGGELGKTQTPEHAAWLKTMPEAEVKAFQTSNSPAFVIRKLAQFYDWKNKAAEGAAAAAKAETEKQDRLKNATTPTGVPRASPQTMSDQEAERKGFEEGFKNS